MCENHRSNIGIRMFSKSESSREGKTFFCLYKILGFNLQQNRGRERWGDEEREKQNKDSETLIKSSHKRI